MVEKKEQDALTYAEYFEVQRVRNSLERLRKQAETRVCRSVLDRAIDELRSVAVPS